jgi:tetratricopeptide (TPR) repeat protein
MDRRAGWIAALAGAVTLAACPALASPTRIPLPRGPSLLPPAPTSRSITSVDGAPLSPAARAAIRALDEVSLAVRTGKTGDAAQRLRLVVASPGFMELPPQLRHIGYAMLAQIDLRDSRLDEAQAMIVQATDLAGAMAVEWELQVNIALARRDDRGAIVALTRLAQDFPAAVPTLADPIIGGIMNRAAVLPDGPDLTFKLGQALIAANWTLKDPFADASRYVVEQMVLLIVRGDLAGARGIIGAVGEPVAMIGPRADKRFDPIKASNPDAFDLKALTERRLASITAAAAAAPTRLAGVRAQATALLELGRYAEALRLLDPALAKAQPAGGGASPYTDVGDELGTSLTLRARALAGLGRYDEALAQMVQAASLPEAGHANVTQRMDLSQLQLQMGRPKDALASLDAIAPTDLTLTGRTNVQGLRVCAEVAAGDAVATQAALAFVRAYHQSAPNAFRDALACTGDMDGAARVLIALLNDPDQRLAALAWAQTLKLPPAPPGPHPNALDRRAALVARPDVKAAIDKVGRVESLPLYTSYF